MSSLLDDARQQWCKTAERVLLMSQEYLALLQRYLGESIGCEGTLTCSAKNSERDGIEYCLTDVNYDETVEDYPWTGNEID